MSGQAAIEWIKQYRSRTGLSLREAKDAFDAGRPMPDTLDGLVEAEKFAQRKALEAAAPDLLDLLMRASEADSPNIDVRTAWWERRDVVMRRALNGATALTP